MADCSPAACFSISRDSRCIIVRCSVKSRTLNPVWNEEFTLIVHVALYQTLNLVVYDSGGWNNVVLRCWGERCGMQACAAAAETYCKA